jgi:hypothetical protein
MTNYVKTTNFLTKDSLPDSDAGKIIRGSEFDTEFNNLVVSIASKANLASPEFTGVPRAPTASAGSKTTQIATTAFVDRVAGALGTMSKQNNTSVNIDGGTITGTTVNGHVVGSNATNNKYISTGGPSGGSNGDLWYRY